MIQEPSPETDELAHAVIGAAIEVLRILGPGFLESIYEQRLCIELRLRGIPFECQKPTKVEYKEEYVGEGRLDLLIDDRLVVELMAVREVAPIHTAIVLSYLKATDKRLALLINFKVSRLKDGVRRLVLS